MRKFRNSALAIATATTVAFGGMTVASAAETRNLSATAENPTKDGGPLGSNNTQGPKLSLELGNALDAEKPADLRALFGSSIAPQTQPTWAQAFWGLGIASAIVAFISLVVGPAYNKAVFG